MRTPVFPALALGAVLLFASCQNTPQTEVKPAVLGHATLKKAEGKDCDKPDTLRQNCASIDMAWPEVKEGAEPLKKSVAAWATQFTAGMLAPAIDSAAAPVTTVDAAAQAFFKTHQEWTKDAADTGMPAYYTAESSDTVLLNDGKHLTLQINAYTYTGGAHGSPQTAVATFEAGTGKVLRWADLVTDSVAMQTLAEKKFRQERADIFEGEDGFRFDDVFPFQLPANYGLTDKGIYVYYNPYEVTPYALGITAFVIPFEELGALWKK